MDRHKQQQHNNRQTATEIKIAKERKTARQRKKTDRAKEKQTDKQIV